MKAAAVSLTLLSALVWLSPARAEPQAVHWQDLRAPAASQPLATNAALIDREIQIKGYLLPVDREGDDVYEFLLVPVAGACSHMPSPPPNQIIHVSLRTPYAATKNYEPVAVTGTLREESEKTQLFIIDGVKIVETAYTIGGAHVAPAPDLPAPKQAGNRLLSGKK